MWNRRLAIATTRLLLTWSKAYILSGVPCELCCVFGDLESQKRSVRSHDPVIRLSKAKFQYVSLHLKKSRYISKEKEEFYLLSERKSWKKYCRRASRECLLFQLSSPIWRDQTLEGYLNPLQKRIDVLFDNSIQSTTKSVCSIRRKWTCKNGCTMVELGLCFGFLAITIVNVIESYSLREIREFSFSEGD